MTVAHLLALPRLEVAPVPLIVDDAFYEFAREYRLPDCSVSFLMRAGSWSARNSRSGFVPSTMLADFSDDPDLVTRTLRAAGLIERARGGVRITEGHGITVINAADVEEKTARKRAADAERQRKSRANRKAARDKEEARTAVTADVTAMSHVTPPIDRSDLDLSPVSRSRSKSKSARTRGPAPGSEAFRLQVTTKFAAVAKVSIGPEIADAIAADVLGAREHVDNPLLYVLAAIENDTDPKGRWLPGHAPKAPAERPPPEWCRKCYRPDDRSVYDAAGRLVGPCPDCSPKSVPAWEVA